jgi:uncharacterized protein YbbC (DUF1343 family)
MQTPLYYSATGVLDGTNLANGVGTTSAFEVVGSPWLDGSRLARRLNTLGLPGVSFEPYGYPFGGAAPTGVRLVVSDPLRFRPATTAVYLLTEIRRQHPRQFQFVSRSGMQTFDLVWGTDEVRKDIMRGAPASAIVARWEPDLRRFQTLRNAFLLYP